MGAPAPLTFVDIETVLNQTAGSPVSINGPNTATTLTGWPSQLHLINGSNTTNNYAEIGFVDSSVSTPPKSALIGVQFTDRTNHYGDLVFATRGTTGGLGERMRVASSGFVGIGTSTPSTALQVIGTTTLAGGFVPNRNQQTGSYTFAASDYLIACAQPASTSVTITLPGASSVAAGQQFIIKDESGNASAAYPIVISGVIQGFTSGHFNITAGFGELRVYSNGSAWFLW